MLPDDYPEGTLDIKCKPMCIVTDDPAGGLPYLEFYDIKGGTKMKRFAQLRSAHPVDTCKVDPCYECNKLYHNARMQEGYTEAGRALARHKEQEVIDAIFKDPKGFLEPPGGPGDQS